MIDTSHRATLRLPLLPPPTIPGAFESRSAAALDGRRGGSGCSAALCGGACIKGCTKATALARGKARLHARAAEANVHGNAHHASLSLRGSRLLVQIYYNAIPPRPPADEDAVDGKQNGNTAPATTRRSRQRSGDATEAADSCGDAAHLGASAGAGARRGGVQQPRANAREEEADDGPRESLLKS